MGTGRLEAFSDGVIAIIITIMVLELKVPHGDELHALTPLLPVFLSYLLSFIYVGIYWNNHHHLLHTTEHVGDGVLWGNLHMLFWLSLIPFVTRWMGENHFAPLPTAMYGFILLMSASAWWLLQCCIVQTHSTDGPVVRVLVHNIKSKISPVLYVAGILTAFYSTWISGLMYVLVALLWLIPNKR